MSTIRSKIVVALFLVTAAVVFMLAVYTSVTLNGITATLNQETQSRLIAESGSARTTVTADEIAALKRDNTTFTDTFATVQDRLTAYVPLHNILAIYYAYKVDDSQMRYIIGAGTALDNNLSSSPVPISDLAREAFNGLVATTPLKDHSINPTESGSLIAYTPVFDAANNIIAVACIEIDDTAVEAASREIRNLSLLFIGSIFIIVIVGCLNVLVQIRKENVLRKQVNQQHLMARISQSFMSQREFDVLIGDTLRMTGEFLNVKRVSLAISDTGISNGNAEYSWIYNSLMRHTKKAADADGDPMNSAAVEQAQMISDIRSVFQEAVRQTFPATLEHDQEMSIVLCSNANREYGKAYLPLAEKGIRAFVWAPIYVEGKLWGVLSVEELKRKRRWKEQDEQLIISVNGALAGLIERHEIDKERAAALEHAIHANAAKSTFLSNMSHEMRTPMNAIMGMTNIAKKTRDPERKDYCLTKIEESSAHLLGMINDILDMSSIEERELVLVPRVFRLTTAIREIVDIIKPAALERNQTLRAEIDHNLPPILIGDDKRFIQVIVNLLSNAVKFTPEEGTITLKVHLEEKREDVCVIKVFVIDTGIGISHEQQLRLFQSFEQAEQGTSRRFGGTGLGLAITKHIVELMHGNVGLISDLGEGSTFFLTVEMLSGDDHDFLELEKREAEERSQRLGHEEKKAAHKDEQAAAAAEKSREPEEEAEEEAEEAPLLDVTAAVMGTTEAAEAILAPVETFEPAAIMSAADEALRPVASVEHAPKKGLFKTAASAIAATTDAPVASVDYAPTIDPVGMIAPDAPAMPSATDALTATVAPLAPATPDALDALAASVTPVVSTPIIADVPVITPPTTIDVPAVTGMPGMPAITTPPTVAVPALADLPGAPAISTPITVDVPALTGVPAITAPVAADPLTTAAMPTTPEVPTATALPVAADSAPVVDNEQDPDFSNYTILLVEDIEINREIVIAMLEPTNIKIDTAVNGLEALQKIRHDIAGYDLIFMDLQMPEMDGLSATQYIRDLPDPRARQIPIVALTANVFQEDVEKALAAGMNAHLGKPISYDDLIRVLNTYLPQKK